MGALKRCDVYSNEIEVRNYDPACEIWRRAMYVPINDKINWEHESGWGLFNTDGETIEASHYYRGPGKKIVGQSISTNLKPSILERAPPGKYIYGGNMIGHYGHFLLSTLSRYWIGNYEDLRQYRIVCHGAGTPNSWFSNPFIRDIFGALGLSKDNFMVFKRPTYFDEILIPRPASEEHNFTHQIFGEFGRMIGRLFLKDFDLEINDRPVWLSKVNIQSGVQGIENEKELVEILQANGVEVFHPQEMPLILQLMLYHTRTKIMGCMGSAFHTKLFGAAGRVCCLIPRETINSNYAITELISTNPIEFYSYEMKPSMSPVKRFTESVDIIEPRAVAYELLERMSY